MTTRGVIVALSKQKQASSFVGCTAESTGILHDPLTDKGILIMVSMEDTVVNEG